MFQKTALTALTLAALAFPALTVAADEPTLQQVYQAAETGKLSEAQAMMDKVLHDHPNSAKAHFVEAEILAKMGRMENADAELRTAQRLDPGLPFVKPQQKVDELRARIDASRNHAVPAQAQYTQAQHAGGGTPWGLIIFGIALLAAIIFFARAMMRRPQVVPAGYGPGYGPGGTMQPYGGGMAPPMGPMPMGGGMGSGIVSGLATGAAIGAGMVAGEALMHHFTDGDKASGNAAPPPAAGNFDAAPNDMGGSDFGIADSGSWDDGGSGGGGDWG